MQFNVPQFTDVEDKVLGPLTMKHFLLLLAGGLLLLALWYLLNLWAAIIVGFPLAIFLAAMVFVKINGRSFTSFFFSWVKFLINPKVYTWQRKEKKI